MPRITEKEVRHIAQLARLALSDEESARLTSQLASILEYVQKLEAVDVSAVEGTSHAVPLDCPLREDATRNEGIRDEVLRLAPREEEGLFAVPKIVS